MIKRRLPVFSFLKCLHHSKIRIDGKLVKEQVMQQLKYNKAMTQAVIYMCKVNGLYFLHKFQIV